MNYSVNTFNECPGPIDNFPLIDKKRSELELKQDLMEHHDYEIIHP